MRTATQSLSTRAPHIMRDPLANPVEVGRLTGTYTMVVMSFLALIGSIWFGNHYDREVIAPVTLFGLAGVSAVAWLCATYIKDIITDPHRRNRFKGFQTSMVIALVVLVVLGFISMAYTNATNGLKVNGIEASIACAVIFSIASFVQGWRTRATISGGRWREQGSTTHPEPASD